MRSWVIIPLALFIALASSVAIGCGIAPGERDEGEEHDGDSEHRGGGTGEESNQVLALDDRHDAMRNGARLTIAYDPETASFKGTVLNTTNQTLCGVRVEIHLSNGTELGPTTPIELETGKQVQVELSAAGHTFDTWSTHPETSPCSPPGRGADVSCEGEGEYGEDSERRGGSEGGEGSEHSGGD